MKLDIKDILHNIEIGNLEYFYSLDESDYKSIYPLVLMRWLYSSKDKKQVNMLNDLINCTIFQNHKHKDLQLKLLMCSVSKSQQNYKWKPLFKKHKVNTSIDLLKEYYSCSTHDAHEYLKLHQQSDLLDMADDIGWDKDKIKTLNKELDGK